MRIIFSSISSFVLFVVCCFSIQYTYAYDLILTPNCQKAYSNIMAMRVSEGREQLINELRANKKNLMPVILINYEDFVSLTFNENTKRYNERKGLLKKRLDALEYADKNSPYYLFGKGLLYLQWSIIKAKHDDLLDAAWDFRKSYLLFSENKKKFPNFQYHNLYLGVQKALISTIPKGYRWISNILGLKGNMQEGIALIQNACKNNDYAFKEEAYLYSIYLKNFLENEPEAALNLIQTYNLDTKNNLLYTFLAANLSLNNKNADKAIYYLKNRNTSKDYMPFPMLDYEMGDAKLKLLDYTCQQDFSLFLKKYSGHFYIKECLHQMSLCAYLQGNVSLANQYRKEILIKGKTTSDADKQAQQFANETDYPDIKLLKAKLLNDGGKNKEALDILKTSNEKSFSKHEEQVEYCYRIARIYDALENTDKAIEFYSKTISLGKNDKDYFAARAALQIGAIYEQKKQLDSAIRYYTLAMNCKNTSFKNSIDQRALSAINRIKK
ncbi:MAG: hypothetical protein R2831_00335 [Chitinophagaceae bacterium]